MIVKKIIKNSDGIEYIWGDEPTDDPEDQLYEVSDWEKEAVREYGVTKPEDVDAALAWREAIDQMDNQQQARVMRGKHPTDESKEIGRPKSPGNRPDNADQQ